MYILKRNGSKENYDPNKILKAINDANADLNNTAATKEQIRQVYDHVIAKIDGYKDKDDYPFFLTVDNINDFIEQTMMEQNLYKLLKQFIEYRYLHKLIRESNTTDDTILSMLDDKDEYWATENSNKDVKVANTQRDYMAGIVSKDISERLLLPKDLVDAHKKGIIHIHDLDYFAQRIFNCDLVNLEDMLQNGTCLSGTMVEKPKSFRTACTVATQIIAQVAGCQHGGQTITLSHLAPFVDVSRQKYISRTKQELTDAGIKYTDDQVNKIAESKLKQEITDGVQTIQYQIQTLLSVNGQSPFISIFMYLNEVSDPKTKDDLALIIEEVLKQRIAGVKNEKGVPITTAFPKLLYCLEEDNITEDSKYWYLTKLAAECSTKRLVPDYISEKKMKELKQGDVFPCISYPVPNSGDIIRINYLNGQSLNEISNRAKYCLYINNNYVETN